MKLLSPFPNFSKFLQADNNSIVFSWEGPRARFVSDYSIKSILDTLQSLGNIKHRDITPDNLVFNGDAVILLDFSFACFPNEITRISQDLGGRYKCPSGFNDEYSLRKVQQELLHE